MAETRSKATGERVKKLDNQLQVYMAETTKKFDSIDSKIDDLGKKMDLLMSKLFPMQDGVALSWARFIMVEACIHSIDCQCYSCLGDCSRRNEVKNCTRSVDCNCDSCFDGCSRKINERENQVVMVESAIQEDQWSEDDFLTEKDTELNILFTLEVSFLKSSLSIHLEFLSCERHRIRLSVKGLKCDITHDMYAKDCELNGSLKLLDELPELDAVHVSCLIDGSSHYVYEEKDDGPNIVFDPGGKVFDWLNQLNKCVEIKSSNAILDEGTRDVDNSVSVGHFHYIWGAIETLGLPEENESANRQAIFEGSRGMFTTSERFKEGFPRVQINFPSVMLIVNAADMVKSGNSTSDFFLAGVVKHGTLNIEGCGTGMLQCYFKLTSIVMNLGGKVVCIWNSPREKGPSKGSFERNYIIKNFNGHFMSAVWRVSSIAIYYHAFEPTWVVLASSNEKFSRVCVRKIYTFDPGGAHSDVSAFISDDVEFKVLSTWCNFEWSMGIVEATHEFQIITTILHIGDATRNLCRAQEVETDHPCLVRILDSCLKSDQHTFEAFISGYRVIGDSQMSETLVCLEADFHWVFCKCVKSVALPFLMEFCRKEALKKELKSMLRMWLLMFPHILFSFLDWSISTLRMKTLFSLYKEPDHVQVLNFNFPLDALMETEGCTRCVQLWKPTSSVPWEIGSNTFVGFPASVADQQWSVNKLSKVAPCLIDRDIAVGCICLRKFYAALAHKLVSCSMQPVCTSLEHPIHLNYCHWHWHFSGCSTVPATTTTY